MCQYAILFYNGNKIQYKNVIITKSNTAPCLQRNNEEVGENTRIINQAFSGLYACLQHFCYVMMENRLNQITRYLHQCKPCSAQVTANSFIYIGIRHWRTDQLRHNVFKQIIRGNKCRAKIRIHEPVVGSYLR